MYLPKGPPVGKFKYERKSLEARARSLYESVSLQLEEFYQDLDRDVGKLIKENNQIDSISIGQFQLWFHQVKVFYRKYSMLITALRGDLTRSDLAHPETISSVQRLFDKIERWTTIQSDLAKFIIFKNPYLSELQFITSNTKFLVKANTSRRVKIEPPVERKIKIEPPEPVDQKEPVYLNVTSPEAPNIPYESFVDNELMWDELTMQPQMTNDELLDALEAKFRILETHLDSINSKSEPFKSYSVEELLDAISVAVAKEPAGDRTHNMKIIFQVENLIKVLSDRMGAAETMKETDFVQRLLQLNKPLADLIERQTMDSFEGRLMATVELLLRNASDSIARVDVLADALLKADKGGSDKADSSKQLERIMAKSEKSNQDLLTEMRFLVENTQAETKTMLSTFSYYQQELAKLFEQERQAKQTNWEGITRLKLAIDDRINQFQSDFDRFDKDETSSRNLFLNQLQDIQKQIEKTTLEVNRTTEKQLDDYQSKLKDVTSADNVELKRLLNVFSTQSGKVDELTDRLEVFADSLEGAANTNAQYERMIKMLDSLSSAEQQGKLFLDMKKEIGREIAKISATLNQLRVASGQIGAEYAVLSSGSVESLASQQSSFTEPATSTISAQSEARRLQPKRKLRMDSDNTKRPR